MLPLVEGEARYEQGEPTLHFNPINYMNEYIYRIPYNPKLTKRSQELRRNMTEPEKRIWFHILQHLDRSGIRVRKQYLIQNFIVDFYIASRKLVIEIDGESHFTETGAIQDTSRTKVLEWEGITVIRFTNNQIMKEIDGVKIEILKHLNDMDTINIEE